MKPSQLEQRLMEIDDAQCGCLGGMVASLMSDVEQPDKDLHKLLDRVQWFLPYGSEIWQEVMRARGLDPRPRSIR